MSTINDPEHDKLPKAPDDITGIVPASELAQQPTLFDTGIPSETTDPIGVVPETYLSADAVGATPVAEGVPSLSPTPPSPGLANTVLPLPPTEQRWYEKTAAKVSAMALGALMFLGIGMQLTKSEAQPESRSGGPVLDDEPADTSPQSTTTSLPPTTTSTPETIIQDVDPASMTASDPVQLLAQFQHNELCMINNRDLARQQVCASYISDPQQTPDQYQQLLESIGSYNSISPREFIPDHRFERDYQLIDSRTNGIAISLLVHVDAANEGVTGEINRSDAYLRLNFVQVYIVSESQANNNDVQQTWFLESQSTVDPTTIENQ